MRRTLLDDRDAVTSVVGAILVAGLIVTVLVTINTDYVPVWEEKEESALMKQVVNQLSDVRSGVHRQTENVTAAPVTTLIPLSGDRGGVFDSPKLPNHVRYEPAPVSVNISSKRVLILSANGTSTVEDGPDETWQGVGTTPVEDIVEVRSLRLRLDEVDISYHRERAWLNFSHKGDKREPLGTFQVRVEENHPDFAVWYKVICHVCSGGSEVLYNQSDTYFGVDEYSPYWIDLLNPEYRFDRILDVADPTMRMTLEFQHLPSNCCGGDGDLTGEYAITYVKQTENGTVLSGGSGVAKTNYTRIFGDREMAGGRLDPGRLIYEARNKFVPDQTYILEHGALIVDQPEGTAFVSRPAFHTDLIGKQLKVSFLLPSAVGQRGSLSGQVGPQVETAPMVNEHLVSGTSNLDINLTTDHPRIWKRFFTEELVDTGLVPTVHFNITSNASDGWVRLDLRGFREPALDSEALDITLRFHQATIRVDLQG